VLGARFGAVVLAAALVALNPVRAAGEERTVVGTLVRLDVPERTLAVQDGMGTVWNFRVDEDAGIDLSALAPGSRVRVTVARATPLNMMSAADRIRKGDRVERIPF
jgi:hypothetical protein